MEWGPRLVVPTKSESSRWQFADTELCFIRLMMFHWVGLKGVMSLRRCPPPPEALYVFRDKYSDSVRNISGAMIKLSNIQLTLLLISLNLLIIYVKLNVPY
jgi:hypothetical protein